MPALLKTVLGISPKVGKDVFLADSAEVLGNVVIGDRSSIWYRAVLRGDVGKIQMGHSCNVQDNAVIHSTRGFSEVIMGDRVSIGHSAIVHGAILEDEVLIGMGAIVMDNARVPTHCLVAAGALVPAGKVLESGYIYAGQPAKKLRELGPKDIEMIQQTADHYIEYATWHQ